MSSDSVVQEKTFQTADELLHALSPRGSFFGKEYEPSRWIFRGHGDAKYELLPQILRATRDHEEPLYLYCNGDWRTIDDLRSGDVLIIAELDTLRRFLDIADRNGQSVPGDSLSTREKFGIVRDRLFDSATRCDRSSDEDLLSWPHRDFQPLMALAQHYGVPTRLLDWTYSCFVAAYFAAADGVQRLNKDSHEVQELSVWALSIGYLEKEPTIELVKVPSAGNPNLLAQRGVFTLNLQALGDLWSSINHVDRRPLDQVVESCLTRVAPDSPALLHVKLPMAEAPALLRLLAKEGFDGARLFPGYYGVSRALFEERYWR